MMETIIFAGGVIIGLLIGQATYKPVPKRNKLNNALFARDIFPMRKS